MRDAWKQFQELSRLFFGRFLENDLICLDGDTKGTLVGILALLAAPGLFLPFFEFIQYGSYPLIFQPWWTRDLVSAPDKVLHIGLSMMVLGIVTVLEWDAILPDRRDYAVLKPLPIAPVTMFSAKLWALARFWTIFTLVISAIPAFFFPVAVVQNGSSDVLLWYVRCHALAVLAGNAFIFFAVIAVQGFMLNFLGWRNYRRFSPYVQSVLVAALLCMFFVSLGASVQVRPGSPLSGLAAWLPPLWFMGFYETQLGWMKPAFEQLSGLAMMALAGAAIVSALAYTVSYSRSIRQSFEQPEGPVARPGRLKLALEELLNRTLLRNHAQRATFHFVRHTITRSRSHRVLVATYFGVGFALVFQSLAGIVASGSRTWWQSPMGPLLPAPLVLSLFLLVGLRYAFSVPAELRANWLFQVSGGADPAEYMAGVRRAVICTAILPLFALLLPIHIALWGWRAGLLHIVYGATVAWLMMELMLVGMEKLPFTCSYVPGKANLKASWPLFVAGYLAYITLFSGVEYLIQQEPSRIVWFFVAAALVKIGVERFRRSQSADFSLVYDERPEPAVMTLGLMQ